MELMVNKHYKMEVLPLHYGGNHIQITDLPADLTYTVEETDSKTYVKEGPKKWSN